MCSLEQISVLKLWLGWMERVLGIALVNYNPLEQKQPPGQKTGPAAHCDAQSNTEQDILESLYLPLEDRSGVHRLCANIGCCAEDRRTVKVQDSDTNPCFPAQVSDHLQAIAKPCGIWVVPIVGGIAIEKQQRYLRSTPEVVVATPGRLWELMRDGAGHLTDMSRLSFLVLDEADRMVQQGHYEVDPLPSSKARCSRVTARLTYFPISHQITRLSWWVSSNE